MKKYYYEDIDENDEISDEDVLNDDNGSGYGPDGRIVLDDPETFSYEEAESEPDYKETETEKRYSGFIGRDLLSVLRNELKSPEFDRGSLDFTWNGKDYEGVPMLEINPDKFVFKLLPEETMKSFKLSEIEVPD